MQKKNYTYTHSLRRPTRHIHFLCNLNTFHPPFYDSHERDNNLSSSVGAAKRKAAKKMDQSGQTFADVHKCVCYCLYKFILSALVKMLFSNKFPYIFICHLLRNTHKTSLSLRFVFFFNM